MKTHIDTLCAEAMARLTSHINRSAGQHARAIKRAFASTPTRVQHTYNSGPLAFKKTTTTPTQPEA